MNSPRLFIQNLIAFGALMSAVACRPLDTADSRLQWGVHNSGRSANILNLLPNQSIEVCADQASWIQAAHEAIQKWSSAAGRWGHLKIVNCGQSADLTINMSGFDSTGLNYFSQRPGKILLNSGASGNFLRAVALHEYGHSFGLCDQYKDAGSANCSDSRSPRQENSEVMGSTNATKLQLTAGDIEGLRAITSDMSIRANKAWANFLQNSKPDATRPDVFASVVDTTNPLRPKIAVSVAQGASLSLCRFQAGVSSCQIQSSQIISMQRMGTTNGRDIYLTLLDVGDLVANNKATFMATTLFNGTSKSSKFALSKK